jgi:hypothetical protein
MLAPLSKGKLSDLVFEKAVFSSRRVLFDDVSVSRLGLEDVNISFVSVMNDNSREKC